jgi:Holliday junction resolvase-like predicted endonuclease
MNRTLSIEKSIEIMVPGNWSNDEKGRFLEDIAGQVLKRQSYDIIERIRFTGMEIDLLASHKPSGDQVYVECKFLSSSVSANVIDLMIAQAFRRNIQRIALFSASVLSKEAKGVQEELRNDRRISFSHYGPEALLESLIDSGVAPSLPENRLLPSVSHATLLVYPDLPYIWLLQDQKDGRPYRIIPYSPLNAFPPSAFEIRDLLNKHEVLEGLPVADYLEIDSEKKTVPVVGIREPDEVVGRIAVADTILDYRPCRPKDFVGRLGIQQELWDSLKQVRDKSTSTRLIALVGASGYGKSSLVSKLAERFKNKKWKNKYFLYPVDVRSARGPLFVSEALLQAIKNAIDEGFLTVAQGLSVSNADNLLSGESISLVLSILEKERKVLVVFFDQFEEVFTKEELLPVFRVFRRFALDVHARQSNLVVGFSWRTGISFSDENPAYQLWNELRDHRITKTLGKFDSAESSRLISQFEKELGTKLLPPLRRRLLEQGQGLPWFLKKLCIHIHGQIIQGVSQSDLLGSRLNVQALFEEDLESLTESQISCIRYIASNSPVDSLEVYERYGNEIVNSLFDKRLVIRAGQRFVVYWDIFRDYLTEGRVPAIPWTYIPNCSVRMALSACDILNSHGALSVAQIAQELNYSEATTVNIITDIQNLALCKRCEDGKHTLLIELNKKIIPERIRSQFIEHVLYQSLLQDANESESISRKRATELVQTLYSGADIKPVTRNKYLTRLIPWLEYAGLIDSEGDHLRVFSGHKHSGMYGVRPKQQRPSIGSLFLASAPPEITENLFSRLAKLGAIKRETISSEHLRNSVQDLSALGLATWRNKELIATAQILTKSTPYEVFIRAVDKSEAMIYFNELLKENPHKTRSEIGELLGLKLSKVWKSSSARRYINGLYRYHSFIFQHDADV